MEHLMHFSHDHPLFLVQLLPVHNNEDSDSEEDEDKVDFVVETSDVGKCKMCKEDIYSFHKCYYSCKDCDYSLHKFCAQLPTIQQNHPLHPNHNLTLSEGNQYHDSSFKFTSDVNSEWVCDICKVSRKRFYNYHCSICKFNMDIICAALSEHKMDHPSHPHQLQRNISWMKSRCNACGNEHNGTFYHCTTCFVFRIHLDCALLPAKLHIQQYTNESFTHSHLLTLAYLFPYVELRAKFFPHCRVCGKGFNSYDWHYRCNRCRYYAHVECATSEIHAGVGKNNKNFKDDDHCNLLRCPFPDESFNLLKYLFSQRIIKEKSEMLCHDSHKHPLILYYLNESVPLHDPMKKLQVLCNGCVRPITDVPFYKCSQHDCDFVLHEWCTRLPTILQDYPSHPEHILVLMIRPPFISFGLFRCDACGLPSNGFAYGCSVCQYYMDINCAFIPHKITHEAHPNHILLGCLDSTEKNCRACYTQIDFGKRELQFLQKRRNTQSFSGTGMAFSCSTCDFYLHQRCAFLIPKMIRHKYDKHPLTLRYSPAENHASEYFCEICEDEFNPNYWFYHCSMCDLSMHTACAPLKLQCEQSTYFRFKDSIFSYVNVKFGGRCEIRDHPHPLTFAQGINGDGRCTYCDDELQYYIILKCLKCKFALHIWCATDLM